MPRSYRRRSAPAPRRPRYCSAQQAKWLARTFISEAVGEWRCDLPDYQSIQLFRKGVME